MVQTKFGYPTLLELCRQPPSRVISFRICVVTAPHALPPETAHVVYSDCVLELRGVPVGHHELLYHAVDPVALGPVRPSVTITVFLEPLLKVPDSSANIEMAGRVQSENIQCTRHLNV